MFLPNNRNKICGYWHLVAIPETWFCFQQESLTSKHSWKNNVSATCLWTCKFPHSLTLWSFLSLRSTQFHRIFTWASRNLSEEAKKKKNTSKSWFILFFLSRQIKLQLSHWLTALYIRPNLFIACGCLFFLKQLAEGALQLWLGSCCRPEHCLLRGLTRYWHESQPSNSFSLALFVFRRGGNKMRGTLPLPPSTLTGNLCSQTAKVNFCHAPVVWRQYLNTFHWD